MTENRIDASLDNGGVYDIDSEIAHLSKKLTNLNKVKIMRDKVIRGMEQSVDNNNNNNIIQEIHQIIRNWDGPYPELGRLFRREEMDWLLAEYLKFVKLRGSVETNLLIGFVIESGYKDKPDLDIVSGKPILRRTTPIHQAFRLQFHEAVPVLFQIYDRLDANYIDEIGLTHFHVACVCGLDRVVAKFLELAQDPNVLVRETGDSPLHLALSGSHKKVAALLIKSGADPNVANKDGSTALHVICWNEYDDDLLKLLFDVSDRHDQQRQPLRINARDKLNRDTPLHLALRFVNEYGVERVAKCLLERGADPNVANDEGFTALHVICQRKNDAADLLETLLVACDRANRVVHVDALDLQGRTPLQWAVANLRPNLVQALLNRGADLSSFLFPTASHFERGFVSQLAETWVHAKLRVVAGARAVVKRLERGGFRLKRRGARTITALFVKYGLFDDAPTADTVHERWYDDEKFASVARNIAFTDDLSLLDLVQLPAEKAEKSLADKDYYQELVFSCDWLKLPQEFRLASVGHLCHVMARGCFYRRWALASLMKLTGNVLPIFCYEMIIETLTNEDLWHVCLASPSSESNKRFRR